MKCNKCSHYKRKYMPFLDKYTMTCDLSKRNAGCKGNYDPVIDKEKEERK